MEGARRHDEPAPPGTPPAQVVHRVHDRYLIEVVEQLGLCPFARRSRELGRVHRPLLYDEHPTPELAATRLLALTHEYPDAEIVLLTFLHASPEPLWDRARDLDDFVKQTREHYETTDGPLFFMVGFHPRSGEPDPGDEPPRLTPDSLVPQLRRTPDPVIQCVRAEVLDRVRRQAQAAAHARALEEARRKYPQLVELLERSVQPDSTLSADIARKNYDSVAEGRGREQLEALLVDIQHERDEAYAPYWRSGSSP